MIGHVKGIVARRFEAGVVVDVHGVGYVVATTADTISKFPPGNEVMLFTYTHVTEQALDLYGFISEGELQMYKMLLSVSGVGPKTALQMMNVGSVESITNAVIRGDIVFLTKVPGIGKKTAERVIVELKHKVGGVGVVTEQLGGDVMFVLDALMSMGYREHEAREAVKHLDPQGKTAEQLIKEALQFATK